MRTYFILLLIFPFYCFSQFRIPKGFSEFREGSDIGQRIKRITVDFDKDRKDDAFSIVYQSGNDFYVAKKKYLLIYLSSKNKHYYIDFDIFNGVYVMPLQYQNDVLTFLVTEEGTGVRGHALKLRFNPKVKNIQLIGYNYSYRIPIGHCNKTYNLLTGDYTIINDFYNMKTEKTEYETFKGNKKLSKSIFINDFSSDLFDNLSSVGRKYERD